MSARVDYNVLLYVFALSFCGSFAALYEGDNCSLQNGSDGKCKLLKECPTAVQLIKAGVFPAICGFVETESIEVMLGFTNKSDPAQVQKRTVIETIRHPEYKNGYHDIGLLRPHTSILY
ncbi:uncharacterized protein LOC111691457 [Anoplophora glabripennis]|uniref:uncharacterized protein LOC111691457 n=1 Tax=Anoplophora glabripennis TaxID=217634 RepID=UPI000C77C3C5|nr:uncharacterized protein LOC111691457 [Anoplophora glabripennis]